MSNYSAIYIIKMEREWKSNYHLIDMLPTYMKRIFDWTFEGWNFLRTIFFSPTEIILMENLEKSSIFVIFLAATKFMEKHLISEHIWDGIVVKDHLFAIGYFVEKDSQDQTNFKGIEELTLERKGKMCTKLNLWANVRKHVKGH